MATLTDAEIICAAPGQLARNQKEPSQPTPGHYIFSSALSANGARSARSQLTWILEHERPDVVHVFGTELPHSLIAVEEAQRLNVPALLSLQGLVSAIADYVALGLPDRIVRGATLRNRLLRDSVAQLRSTYETRGRAEMAAIMKSRHVMGRTHFDSSFVKSHNPSATYHHGDELLRPSFYEANWDLGHCEPHRIFVSQGSNPLKGVHTALKGLALVKKVVPGATMAIGGRSRVNARGARARLEQTRYDRYLAELVRDLRLESSVEFTGTLDEAGMRDQFLRAHVFLLSSSIENSPNSLAEAMILGTPVVASLVGGVPDMVTHRHDALCFPAGSAESLAQHILELFRNPELAMELSTAARSTARRRHETGRSVAQLLSAYQEMLGTRSHKRDSSRNSDGGPG